MSIRLDNVPVVVITLTLEGYFTSPFFLPKRNISTGFSEMPSINLSINVVDGTLPEYMAILFFFNYLNYLTQ